MYSQGSYFSVTMAPKFKIDQCPFNSSNAPSSQYIAFFLSLSLRNMLMTASLHASILACVGAFASMASLISSHLSHVFLPSRLLKILRARHSFHMSSSPYNFRPLTHKISQQKRHNSEIKSIPSTFSRNRVTL